MSEFKEEMRHLMMILGAFNYKEVAQKLGISEEAVKSWGRRKAIPKKYQNINNSTIINGNNNNINTNSNNDLENELIKAFRELSEKRQEYYYHKIKAEVLED